MRRAWLLVPCILAASLLYAAVNRPGSSADGFEIARPSSPHSLRYTEPETSAGLCPWRAPDKDRRRYFPGSTATRDETLILSRQRLEVQKRLGRMPGADDNALIVHRIVGTGASPGVVVTRRVRGECGLIELVLATDSSGRVLGAEIQRHREPASTAQALQSEQWLSAFHGKDSHSAWKLGEDVPDVPRDARTSAEAVLAETRTVLILLDVALHSDTSLPPDINSPATGRG
jgi:hypothetical protein